MQHILHISKSIRDQLTINAAKFDGESRCGNVIFINAHNMIMRFLQGTRNVFGIFFFVLFRPTILIMQDIGKAIYLRVAVKHLQNPNMLIIIRIEHKAKGIALSIIFFS